MNSPYCCISDDVFLGKDVSLSKFINLYGCHIGECTKIGSFVEIQRGVSIGKNCKIQSHSFICEGVSIGNGVFVGHGVMFTNDKYPRAINADGTMQTDDDWNLEKTIIEDGVSIGTGATILCGITIRKNAIIGAGAVVTKDVQSNTIVAGNPAKYLKSIETS